jgi:HSP20 family protein
MRALSRRDRFEDLFPDFFRRFARPLSMTVPEEAAADIAIDLTESDKAYHVRAEIPGAKKEDVHVSVDRNFVTISAEIKREKEETSGNRMLMKETYHGSASRGFSLGHEIDEKAVTAKLEDGVLKLTLPKTQASGSRAITIQ